MATFFLRKKFRRVRSAFPLRKLLAEFSFKENARARAPCLIGDVIIVTVDGLVVVGQSWARESISTFSVVNFYF